MRVTFLNGRAMAQAVSRRPLTTEVRVRSRVSPVQWWTKRHWDRVFLEYFVFPLSISFHRCSITRKNRKKLIIFITGLHNKPQDCGASVASAEKPFTKKILENFASFFRAVVGNFRDNAVKYRHTFKIYLLT
jgi:hypothetical protein